MLNLQFIIVSVYLFFIQAVYNANKFAKLIRKRDRLQNWLDYNKLKFERNQSKKPTTKVAPFAPKVIEAL